MANLGALLAAQRDPLERSQLPGKLLSSDLPFLRRFRATVSAALLTEGKCGLVGFVFWMNRLPRGWQACSPRAIIAK